MHQLKKSFANICRPCQDSRCCEVSTERDRSLVPWGGRPRQQQRLNDKASSLWVYRFADSVCQMRLPGHANECKTTGCGRSFNALIALIDHRQLNYFIITHVMFGKIVNKGACKSLHFILKTLPEAISFYLLIFKKLIEFSFPHANWGIFNIKPFASTFVSCKLLI